jgi:hypothetical protein
VLPPEHAHAGFALVVGGVAAYLLASAAFLGVPG